LLLQKIRDLTLGVGVGFILIRGEGRVFLGAVIFKYCNRASIHGSPLNAQNQPIYEAMFLELAKILGLEVPEYFVITNPNGGHVSFSYEPDQGENIRPLSNHNKSYFVSRLTPHPIIETGALVKGLMSKDKIYRDLLNIGNVSDRPENYTLVDPKGGAKPFILYIDLGCGLVDAHSRNLTLRTGLERKRSSLLQSNALKRIKRDLSRAWLTTRDGKSEVNLLQFGEKIPACCRINILDASSPSRIQQVPVTKLLTNGELSELSSLYFVVNSRYIGKYKRDPRLIMRRG
jgi:hypothetical protein